MAFSVQDFHDLVRLVEQRPEWRDELRRLVLSEDLLGLPAIVRALAEAQLRTEERLAGVEERLAGVEERLAGVEERLAGVEERLTRLEAVVTELAEAQRRTEGRVERLEQRLAEVQLRIEQQIGALIEAQMRTDRRLDRLEQQVGELRSSDRERRYRDRASAYFGRLLRRVRVVPSTELDDLLDEGMATGALDEDSAQDVRWADLIVSGRRAGEEADTYLVVEVSVAIDPDDVERAARRAALLGRLRPSLALVAGDRLTAEAVALAETRGVWQMFDGRAVAPGSAV